MNLPRRCWHNPMLPTVPVDDSEKKKYRVVEAT